MPTRADLARLDGLLGGAKALLLQLELPLPAVLGAATLARRAGVPVILDPAPAPPQGLPDELYALADVITPNESEAAALVGFALHDQAAAERAAALLRTRGSGTAILKLGARGALLAEPGGTEWLAPFPVAVVDSVAAGDAFNGALGAAFCEGCSLREAARRAMAAGALAVTKRGAQEAMPTRAELEALLQM
jgi:ribokinase